MSPPNQGAVYERFLSLRGGSFAVFWSDREVPACELLRRCYEHQSSGPQATIKKITPFIAAIYHEEYPSSAFAARMDRGIGGIEIAQGRCALPEEISAEIASVRTIRLNDFGLISSCRTIRRR